VAQGIATVDQLGGSEFEGQHSENRKWKLEAGKWKIETGKWRIETGKWKFS
jgi:hypothetical protein